VALFAAACSTRVPKQTELMKEFGVKDFTTRELRAIVYGFGSESAGKIELSAQEIQDSADSPEIRENAVLWKMNAVPVIYQATFTQDPLAALSTSWAFCVQMRKYFTTGAGRELFGEWQDIAVNVSQELEADAFELAKTVMPETDLLKAQESLEAYADNNPFENQLFVRTGDTLKFLKASAGTSSSGLVAAASMSEEMRTLADRMSIFTVTVPKQVQWQTELLMARAAGIHCRPARFGHCRRARRYLENAGAPDGFPPTGKGRDCHRHRTGTSRRSGRDCRRAYGGLAGVD
jgi:hypothetical protein